MVRIKYQNLNRSCSYSAIANLMLDFSIDTEDYEILKSIKIPYIFNYLDKEDKFIAGPMLQGKKWFDYYLISYGLEFKEIEVQKNKALECFNANPNRFMVGLNMGNIGKHAVIFEGRQENNYQFLNIKREDSCEPDYYLFDSIELFNKLDDCFLVGWIEETNKSIALNNKHELKKSVEHIKLYKKAVVDFCSENRNSIELADAKSNLFEAFFLDVFSMMKIINELNLVKKIECIRRDYINAMSTNPEHLILSDYLKMDEFLKTIDYFQLLVEKEYKKSV